jgi:hypothetical protein
MSPYYEGALGNVADPREASGGAIMVLRNRAGQVNENAHGDLSGDNQTQ